MTDLAKIVKPLKPCPICGGEPEIDTGFTDAPYETPLVVCRTWHIEGDLTIRCPMHADGVDAWNYLCGKAGERKRPTTEGEPP